MTSSPLKRDPDGKPARESPKYDNNQDDKKATVGYIVKRRPSQVEVFRKNSGNGENRGGIEIFITVILGTEDARTAIPLIFITRIKDIPRLPTFF